MAHGYRPARRTSRPVSNLPRPGSADVDKDARCGMNGHARRSPAAQVAKGSGVHIQAIGVPMETLRSTVGT